jgi:glycerol-3-phosphate dehydrogenase
MSHGMLNAAQRAADLADLRDGAPLDVLVIGGGITGAGAALDAASRGLRTALVERHDLAFGTSRWSSKLVHGGLRYLAQGAFGIAYESARERHVLLTRTAPHLVRPIRQAFPLTPQVSKAAERETRIGLALGDGLRRAAGTPATLLPRAHRVDQAAILQAAPGVRRDGLRGGLIAHDAQLEDDARLVVAVARTAHAHGAAIVTRADVTATGPGGARLTDTLTGESFEVRARAIVNATGVWAGDLAPELTLRPSRGTHLVLPLDALGGLTGQVSVPVPGARNRWVFAIAQRSGVAYAGLTDEAVPGPIPDVPDAPESDVEFLLTTLSSALERPLTRADVIGTYAGLRPLVETGDAATTTKSADLSRRHAVVRGPGGRISVVGGKLTTYRRMAQDAIDAAVEAAALTHARPCRTADLPLLGAAAPSCLRDVRAVPQRLIDRHGTEAPNVLALAHGDPALLQPLVPGSDVLAVEVLHAARAEGALSADDVLDRRTRLGLIPDTRVQARPVVQALLDEGRQATAA